MLSITWKLGAAALALGVNMVTAQPEYVGRVPCPSNSSLLGYTNTTLLNDDIVADMKWVFDGGEEPEFYQYVLCPQTEFIVAKQIGEQEAVGESPIIPGLANSFFTCGEDGNSENNCVITGGDFHFYFPDFVIAEEVYIMGVTFTNVNGASVYGDAHPASHVVFLDCHWKFNKGSATVYVHYTPEEGSRRLESGEPYKQEEMNEIMRRDAQALVDLKEAKSSRDLQAFVKYSMSCVFVDCTFLKNDDFIATLFNLGGAVELIDTTFEENDVAELSVFSNLANGHAFIHEKTNFKKNFARLGPVFVDNSSFLQLSRDNFGTANSGGQCAGIFLEDDLSLCFDREATCTGQCCAFGDETCDLYIEEDDEEEEDVDVPPETSTMTEVEEEETPKTAPAPQPAPVDTPATTTTSVVDTSPQSGSSCGGFCKGFVIFAVAFGVALVVVIGAFMRRRRLKKSTIAGPATSDPPQLDRTIT